MIPLRLSTVASHSKISRCVARAVVRSNLKIKSMGSLATRHGSIHWRIVKPDEKGTLELTFVPQTNALWFAIHENRKAAWIPEKIGALRKYLEE